MGELGARCREFLDQRLAVLRSAPLVGSRQGSFQVVQREFGAVAQGAGLLSPGRGERAGIQGVEPRGIHQLERCCLRLCIIAGDWDCDASRRA